MLDLSATLFALQKAEDIKSSKSETEEYTTEEETAPEQIKDTHKEQTTVTNKYVTQRKETLPATKETNNRHSILEEDDNEEEEKGVTNKECAH